MVNRKVQKVKTDAVEPFVFLSQMSHFRVLGVKNDSFELIKHRGSRVQFSPLEKVSWAAAQLTFHRSENAMLEPLCFPVSNASFLGPRTTSGASRPRVA